MTCFTFIVTFAFGRYITVSQMMNIVWGTTDYDVKMRLCSKGLAAIYGSGK